MEEKKKKMQHTILIHTSSKQTDHIGMIRDLVEHLEFFK